MNTSQLQCFCSIIKRSRASEQSDQAIKDDFHGSKFLIPVTNASTGNVYVTTPCSSCMMACMPSLTIPLNGWMIVPRTAAVSLNISFARLQGGFIQTPSNPPGSRPVCCYNFMPLLTNYLSNQCAITLLHAYSTNWHAIKVSHTLQPISVVILIIYGYK